MAGLRQPPAAPAHAHPPGRDPLLHASLARVRSPCGLRIVDHTTWRRIFYLNLPIGAIALTVIAVALKLPRRRLRGRLDYGGMVLLGGAITCVVLLTSWSGTSYWWGSPVIAGLGAGAAALHAGWWAIERRAADPVIPLRLFVIRSSSSPAA